MIVEQLTLRNVMSHKDTRLAFPARGVVALSGENGNGKSAIIEGLSVALWGQTLRGTDPWADADGEAHAQISLHGQRLHVLRTRKKGKLALSWHRDGEAPTKFETLTKAQGGLETVIGEWDVWRRSSVFSSSDADNFSAASDGDKKRMLESVLGVDMFDDALKACRTDAASADMAAVLAEKDLAASAERVRLNETRVQDADAALAGDPLADPAPLEAQAAKLREMLAGCTGEISQGRNQLRKADRAGAEEAMLARQLEATLERLRGDACPVCSQAIPEALRGDLMARADAAKVEAHAHAAKAREANADLESVLADLEQERQALDERYRQAASAASAAKQAVARIAQLQKQRGLAEKDLYDARARLSAAELSFASAKTEAKVLRACERVLGLKGVRAHVTARALGGLESVANLWLSRVAGQHLRVRLSPFTETKTAGLSDKIAFEVEGAANGNGYRGTSGGQRRRIDVALLLALAEFVAAAHGREGGTLFADEVFDALDEDGRSRVVGILHELGKERAVIVVTHSQELLAELAPDAHWRVGSGGQITAS